MFLPTKPNAALIADFRKRQQEEPFTYKETEMTRRRLLGGSVEVPRPMAGYKLDHNRVRLGSGRLVFDSAKAALRQWQQFDLGWVEVANPDCPIESGQVVCLCLPLMGVLWTLFACRIVYTVDDRVDNQAGQDPQMGTVARFGFAYGTLPGHPESGEESFTVEWHQEDDSVWYDLLAYSRPGSLLVQAGLPFARHMQKKLPVIQSAPWKK